MATTYTDQVGNPAASWMDGNRPVVLKSPDIDITGCVVNDVFQALTIPAGMVIIEVYSMIVTACDVGSSAFGVGDGSGTTSWDAAVSATAAAGTIACSAKGTDAYAAHGKYYSAEDTIDIIMSTCASTSTAGKIRLYAVGFYV